MHPGKYLIDTNEDDCSAQMAEAVFDCGLQRFNFYGRTPSGSQVARPLFSLGKRDYYRIDGSLPKQTAVPGKAG